MSYIRRYYYADPMVTTYMEKWGLATLTQTMLRVPPFGKPTAVLIDPEALSKALKRGRLIEVDPYPNVEAYPYDHPLQMDLQELVSVLLKYRDDTTLLRTLGVQDIQEAKQKVFAQLYGMSASSFAKSAEGLKNYGTSLADMSKAMQALSEIGKGVTFELDSIFAEGAKKALESYVEESEAEPAYPPGKPWLKFTNNIPGLGAFIKKKGAKK